MLKNITTIRNHFNMINTLINNDIAYNIVLASKIVGNLNKENLQSSWKRVTKEITELADAKNLDLIVLGDDNIAIEFIKKLSNQKFDLSNERLPLRGVLIEISESLHYFCIIQHHVLIDLHSKNLLSKVISECYNKGEITYNFTIYKETTKCKLNIDIWSQQLVDHPAPLVLPSAFSERGNFTGDGHSIFTDMTFEVRTELQILENEYQLQEFIVFLASYAVILAGVSQQNDFFIGVPFSNRKNPEREYMYGPFVNILPLRVAIEEGETFSSLYLKIRKQMLLLNRNQEAPFLEIVKHYNGRRDAKIPFFLQAGFTREEPFNLDLKGLKCSPVDIRPDGAQMDLFLTYWQESGRYRCRWEYNTKAFTENQVNSWCRSFKKVFAQAVTTPEMPVSEIDLISDDDKNNLLNFYSKNERDYPLEISLKNHLEQIRKKHSELTAIKDKTRSLTYNQFDQLIKKYSSILFSKIGTGKYIAVSIDNSIERTILIHAIVHSGNVYIPIDPNWPASRVDHILENVGASLAVIEKRNEGHYTSNVEMVFIDFFDYKVETAELNISKHPHDPFAVLYTSGSTGNPKGVIINGDGLLNRIFWMQDAYPLNAGDSLMHKVPFTFDVSMWEIFWPFLTGASLYIPEPAKYLDDNYLADTIREQKIKYVHFVPSLLKKFLDNISNTALPDLKAVICSGEAFETSLLEQFLNKVGNKPIHNLYGPTEASIDVTAWTCTAEDLEEKRIPIGYPIANTRIYILDKYGNLCLPYVKGEIAIAGINVSSGYINNPDLTSKVFIEGDWGFGTERVYLTGDLGFYSSEGVIYYDGRKDTQVKINGIRIELAEIERQIEKLDSVKIAVVLIPGKETGDMSINAFLKVADGVDITAIKKELSKVLPGYMIPANFILIDEFPMLTSGKINRKELSNIVPKMEPHAVEKAVLSEGPLADIRQIWSELLNISDIPADISFFDLGGHSQLLPELKKRLEDLSGAEIELIDLFNYPTVQSQREFLARTKPPEVRSVDGDDRRKMMRRAAERSRQRKNG